MKLPAGVLAVILTTVLGACGDVPVERPDAMPGGPDAMPAFDLSKWPTVGPRGNVGFAIGIEPADRAIALGSQITLTGWLGRMVPPATTVTSGDTAVLTLGGLSYSGPAFFAAAITATGVGDADVIAADASGMEIDRYTLHVRATDELAYNRNWGAGNALVLAGAVERWHVSTKTAGAITAGTGAVTFTLGGALAPARAEDAPWLLSGGDNIFFAAGASGTGTVTASAPNATATLTIEIVPASALTALVADPPAPHFVSGGEIAVGASLAGKPVFGARCSWLTFGLRIDLQDANFSTVGHPQGWIDAEPAFHYWISGGPGQYNMTCTIPGGPSLTIPVQID